MNNNKHYPFFDLPDLDDVENKIVKYVGVTLHNGIRSLDMPELIAKEDPVDFLVEQIRRWKRSGGDSPTLNDLRRQVIFTESEHLGKDYSRKISGMIPAMLSAGDRTANAQEALVRFYVTNSP